MAKHNTTDGVFQRLRTDASVRLKDAAGKRVLVALSGGPDSVALCYCLRAFADEIGFVLCAAHLDHGMRAEAASDAAFVANLCESWGIPLICGKVDVPALAAARGGGAEEAARVARYAFLERTASQARCDRIALGHHMDDQAETFLLAATRGSGLAGLRGMAVWNEPYWRPFLGIRRAQIIDLIAENQLAFVHDASNDSDVYARNRLRKTMPDIEAIHGGAIENIARTMTVIAEDEAALEAWAERAWDECQAGGRLAIDALMRQPMAIRVRLVKRLASEAGLSTGFSRANAADVLTLCRKPSGRRVDLPNGYCACREYGFLRIGQVEVDGSRDAGESYALPLVVPGRTVTPDGVFVCERITAPAELGREWPDVAEVAPHALENAVVRQRQPGDWIRPLGAPGRKALKAFYIDKKVPRSDRYLPVIARGDEVIVVPGWGVSERIDVSGCPEVIRISFRRAANETRTES